MSGQHDFFFSRYIPEGDTIQAVFHRHFFVIFPNMLFWLLLPIGGVVYSVYHWYYPQILTSPFLGLFEGYIFFLFIIMLYKALDWYGDAWILTERGLIDTKWSLFMKKMVFTEYHDISSIESLQNSLFDKIFHIGDITIHKMGNELKVRQMYRPDEIVEALQSKLQDHHDEGHAAGSHNPDMHIYLDGFKHSPQSEPYRNGYRYTPSGLADEKFVESVKQKPGTIDLSGPKKETLERRVSPDSSEEHH